MEITKATLFKTEVVGYYDENGLEFYEVISNDKQEDLKGRIKYNKEQKKYYFVPYEFSTYTHDELIELGKHTRYINELHNPGAEPSYGAP